MDAGEQAEEIVLATESEDGIYQVMTDTRLALLDLEAVGEEIQLIPDSLEVTVLVTLPIPGQP